MPKLPPFGVSKSSSLPRLPKIFDALVNEPVWGLFRRNPEGSKKKYTVNCRANDPTTLRDLHTALEHKTDAHVVVLSIQLSQTHLDGHLHFWDIDKYHSSAFDSSIYDELLKHTYTEESPSGKGAHSFFLTPKDKLYVPKFAGKQGELPEGYDIHNTGFVTMTFNMLSATDNIIRVTNELHLKNKKVPLSEKNPMSPYLENGNLSPIWCYNMQTDVQEILADNGYIQRGKKWLAPTSTTGNPGVYVNESLRGSWNGTYSLHDSDPLSRNWLDPYGVLSALTKISLAELAKDTLAIDPETGELLDISVDIYNRRKKALTFSIKPAEPIQRMIDAYASTISTPIPSFYTCTVYSHLSLFMQNTVKMPLMGMRGTNTLFMMLAFSAAGKDNNVSVPTQGIGGILQPLARQQGMESVCELLDGMVHRMPKVTVLSALLKELDKDQSRRGRIWMDTDCKDLLGKFQGNDSNGVSQLTDAIIEIADGIRITGMTKAQEDLQGYDESIPVLLASQTDVALELFTEELMARGFFGRFDFILHKDDSKTKIINPFVKGNVKPFRIEDAELLKWLLYCLRHASKLRANELNKFVVADVLPEALTALEVWFNKYVSDPSAEWSEDRKKFISRVSMSIEKMATIDAWAEHMWKCFKTDNPNPYKTPIRISAENVQRYFSYAEYQVNVRNGEVLTLIKAKPKSINTKQEQSIMLSLKELLKEPDKWCRKYHRLNTKIAKSHGIIGRSILQQKTGINSTTIKPMLKSMDGGDIIYHKKGDVIVNAAGEELTLRGEYIGALKA